MISVCGYMYVMAVDVRLGVKVFVRWCGWLWGCSGFNEYKHITYLYRVRTVHVCLCARLCVI